MKSEMCRQIDCRYFGKFSGKAVCRFETPKRYVKHMQSCHLILKKE